MRPTQLHSNVYNVWNVFQIRYVPDLELKQLRKELDDLGGPIVAPTRRR